jgi:hypothetical protein
VAAEQETARANGGWESPPLLASLAHRDQFPSLLNAMHLLNEGRCCTTIDTPLLAPPTRLGCHHGGAAGDVLPLSSLPVITCSSPWDGSMEPQPA